MVGAARPPGMLRRRPALQNMTTLQDQALALLLLFPGGQGSAGSVFKYFPYALVCLCGALEVLLGTDLLTDILGLCVH